MESIKVPHSIEHNIKGFVDAYGTCRVTFISSSSKFLLTRFYLFRVVAFLFNFKMILRRKVVWELVLSFLITLIFAAAIVHSSPTPGIFSSYDLSMRHPKTLNMSMGMDFIKDMFQNGMQFRPTAPQFPSLKNLFKSNGTNLSWVPLGSLIFQNNGKIIGG